jgi:hypothetical protein
MQILPLLKKFEIDDTFFISPFYYLSEILFFGLAYSFALGGRLKKPVIFITLMIFVLEIANTIWGEGYKDAQPLGSFTFSAYNIILALLYIRSFYINKIRSNGLKDSFFVISWAILIPSSLSILFYLLTKSLFEADTLLYYNVSIFRMAAESICFLVFAYGVTLIRVRTT